MATPKPSNAVHHEEQARRTPALVRWARAWALWNDQDSRGRPRGNWHGERPWPAGDESPEHYHHEKSTVSASFLRHEARLIIAGAISLLVLAVVIGFVMIGGSIALVVIVPVLLAYMAFVTMPIWMAALVDDAEDHKGEFEDEAEATTKAE